MSLPKEIYDAYPFLQVNTILLGWRGSIAHGTYIPEHIDDKDLMGVVVPDYNCYFGTSSFGSRGTKEIVKNEWDIVCYELKKFVTLLMKGNPNVISMLWLEKNYYLILTDIGQRLIESRDLFSSRQIYHSFVGYAYSQLKRMTHFHFEGYMGEKRKKLVEQFGYDCKNASHLIRLLRMAIEFLREQRFIVQRPDASELLDIKLGKWTLEQVKAESDRLFRRAEQAYDECTLPAICNESKINDLLIDLHMKHFGILT